MWIRKSTDQIVFENGQILRKAEDIHIRREKWLLLGSYRKVELGVTRAENVLHGTVSSEINEINDDFLKRYPDFVI